MAQGNPQALALTQDEIEHIKARRAASEAEAEAKRKAEAERLAREKAVAAARAKAEAAATGAAKARVRSDAEDIEKLLDGAQQCVAAIRSIRAHIPSDGDATQSAGRLLQALLRRGGSIHEYHSEGQIWAIKHALGGEGSTLAPIEGAAVILVTTLIEGLADPRHSGEAERRSNIASDLEAMANILAASATLREAQAAVESLHRSNAEARARQHKIEHDRRLAQAASGRHSTLSASHRAVPVAASMEGEYIPDDSADAPGASIPVG